MNALRARLADMSPRERRLLVALGVVGLAILVFFIPVAIGRVVTARRDENKELRDVIERVQAARGAVGARKARREAIAKRYEKKAPKLAGFLDQLARDAGIEIPESQDKPEVPIGTSKRYVERATTFRLRGVAGYPLLTFLERIEQSGYPVSLSRLNLRKKGDDHDAYDVELGVSAFDRTEPTPAPPAATPNSSATPQTTPTAVP